MFVPKIFFFLVLLFIEKPHQSRQEDFSMPTVKAVQIPDSVSFAGENVPLNDPEIKERLIRELEQNCYKHAATLQILRREGRWKKRILAILKEKNIPEDFFYLAVAESELDNYALSNRGAMGFWQFMPETAKEFGLEVNEYVDFRKDPIYATYAACEYFLKAQQKFTNWTLAAASYNRGMAGIQKAVTGQKVNSYYDLYLNQETHRYIFRIIALKLILENPKKYGFQIDEKDRYQALDFTEIEINEGIPDLPAFAMKYGITYRVLKIYNPWLDSGEYKLALPKNKSYKFRLPEQK